MGKSRYVIWYVGGMVYGKSKVCDMVCWWYGMMVRCGGCIIWLNSPGGMVCFSI